MADAQGPRKRARTAAPSTPGPAAAQTPEQTPKQTPEQTPKQTPGRITERKAPSSLRHAMAFLSRVHPAGNRFADDESCVVENAPEESRFSRVGDKRDAYAEHIDRAWDSAGKISRLACRMMAEIAAGSGYDADRERTMLTAAGVKAIVRLWPESEGLLHKFFNLDTDATVCRADMCGASDPSHFRYLMSEAQTNSPAWESSETLSALSMLNYYKTFAKHQYCAAACDLMSVIWTWFDEGYLDDGDAEEVLKMLGARCGAKTAAKALKMHARGGFVDDYLGEILKKKTFITNADEMRKVLPWW